MVIPPALGAGNRRFESYYPDVKDKIISFRLTEEEYQTLSEMAKANKTSVSNMLRILISNIITKPLDTGYNPEGLKGLQNGSNMDQRQVSSTKSCRQIQEFSL